MGGALELSQGPPTAGARSKIPIYLSNYLGNLADHLCTVRTARRSIVHIPTDRQTDSQVKPKASPALHFLIDFIFIFNLLTEETDSLHFRIASPPSIDLRPLPRSLPRLDPTTANKSSSCAVLWSNSPMAMNVKSTSRALRALRVCHAAISSKNPNSSDR